MSHRYVYRLLFLTWALLGLSGVGGRAAEGAKVNWPAFSATEPLPGVLARAKSAGLELRAASAPDTTTEFKPGDTVAFLATLVSGQKRTQWIVELRIEEPTEKEQLAQKTGDQEMFTSTGTQFVVSHAKSPVGIAVLGPFKGDASENVKVRRKRVLVERDSLHGGLTGFSVLITKATAFRKAQPAGTPPRQFSFQFGPKPFPEDVVVKNRAAIEGVGLTAEDERSFAGTLPALLQFFSLIGSTPGLDEMLKSVIDVPYWGIIKSAGNPDINLNLNSLEMGEAGALPALPFKGEPYSLGITLSIAKKPSLLTRLAVIKPVAPYEASAGMVGLVAGAPDGKGPVLTLQLISSFTAAN